MLSAPRTGLSPCSPHAEALTNDPFVLRWNWGAFWEARGGRSVQGQHLPTRPGTQPGHLGAASLLQPAVTCWTHMGFLPSSMPVTLRGVSPPGCHGADEFSSGWRGWGGRRAPGRCLQPCSLTVHRRTRLPPRECLVCRAWGALLRPPNAVCGRHFHASYCGASRAITTARTGQPMVSVAQCYFPALRCSTETFALQGDCYATAFLRPPAARAVLLQPWP